MATIKQIQANRLNSQRSTGPRSLEGKSRASMNALKSGINAQSEIIAGEDAAALDFLIAEYVERFQPATPEERHCVDVLVRDEWLLRRLARAEAHLWQYEIQSTSRWPDKTPIGKACALAGDNFNRLQRRIDSLQRSYQRTLHELERRQSRRPDPPATSQAVENPRTLPEIGFVPSNVLPPGDSPRLMLLPPHDATRIPPGEEGDQPDYPYPLLKIPA